MTERTRWLLLVLTLIVGLGGAVYGNVLYTNGVDQRRAAAERRAADDRTAQSEQARLIFCRVALTQAEAFKDATSQVGRDARQGWLDLAALLRCPAA